MICLVTLDKNVINFKANNNCQPFSVIQIAYKRQLKNTIIRLIDLLLLEWLRLIVSVNWNWTEY